MAHILTFMLVLLVLQANAWTLKVWNTAFCGGDDTGPNRIIRGRNNRNKCFDFAVRKDAFKFDQRDNNGNPGACIATLYSDKGCHPADAVHNSIGTCGGCRNTADFCLDGPCLKMYNSVRVRCGRAECRSPGYSCGVNCDESVGN